MAPASPTPSVLPLAGHLVPSAQGVVEFQKIKEVMPSAQGVVGFQEIKEVVLEDCFTTKEDQTSELCHENEEAHGQGHHWMA